MTSRPALLASIRALPRPAWILFAGTFINRFGGFVLVFLVLYLTGRGYSAAQAGAALSLYGVGTMAAAPLAGHLADRMERRTTIALSMFLSGVFVLWLSQATSLSLILPLTFLTGFTGQLYRPAAAAMVADLTPTQHRVTGYAVYRLAINGGFAAGAAVAGFLAERSFLTLFVVDAASSIAFGAIALVALPARLPRATLAESSTLLSPAMMLRDRRFVWLLAACVTGELVNQQSVATLPLHIRAAGLSTASYGWLMSLNGLLIIALELSLTTLTTRVVPRAALAAGLVLTGIGFGLTAFASTVPLLGLTVVIWTFGEMVFSPVLFAHVADLAPGAMLGRYQAAIGLAMSTGMVVGPIAGTALFALNPGVLWSLCAALGVVAAGMVLRGR